MPRDQDLAKLGIRRNRSAFNPTDGQHPFGSFPGKERQVERSAGTSGCFAKLSSEMSNEALRAIIAPSVLASDFAKIGSESERIINDGADWLHMG